MWYIVSIIYDQKYYYIIGEEYLKPDDKIEYGPMKYEDARRKMMELNHK